MDSQPTDKLKPALIGGLALGLASSIPILSCFNCLCCMLVIFGGLLAGWLYMNEAAPSPEPRLGEGALVGAGAGLVGAVVAAVVGFFFQLLMTRTGFSDPEANLLAIQQALAEAGIESTVQMERFVEWMLGGAFILASMVIFPLFGALGGLLAAAFFHKKPAAFAPPPPVVPQPPSTLPPPPAA
jgi:uncharacterized membrane protein